MNGNGDRETVEQILAEKFDGCVYSVEDGVVWVSGMNESCASVASRMARTLVAHDVPCGLVYDDDATAFGGVQFNWGEST